MKITDVEPIVLRLPQVDATRADGTQDAFLVRVHTDEGIVGIGEADTAPLVARTIIDMPSSHSPPAGCARCSSGRTRSMSIGSGRRCSARATTTDAGELLCTS